MAIEAPPSRRSARAVERDASDRPRCGQAIAGGTIFRCALGEDRRLPSAGGWHACADVPWRGASGQLATVCRQDRHDFSLVPEAGVSSRAGRSKDQNEIRRWLGTLRGRVAALRPARKPRRHTEWFKQEGRRPCICTMRPKLCRSSRLWRLRVQTVTCPRSRRWPVGRRLVFWHWLLYRPWPHRRSPSRPRGTTERGEKGDNSDPPQTPKRHLRLATELGFEYGVSRNGTEARLKVEIRSHPHISSARSLRSSA